MKAVKKLTIAGGKYMYNGETRTRWVTVGTMFLKDNGTYTILLNAGINLAAYSSKDPGHEGEVWANLFDIDKDKKKSSKPDQEDSTSEDIPF